MPRIDRLTRGSTPTLLEANKGNELIDAINGLANMQSQSDLLTVNVDDSYNVQLDLAGITEQTVDIVKSDNTAGTANFLVFTDTDG